MLSVDVGDFREFAARCRVEADGAQLRRDFVKALRVAVMPAVAQAKANIKSMASRTGGRRPGGSLRSKVASKVQIKAQAAGKYAGLRVIVAKRGLPRGFVNAPQRLNTTSGWRHPVYGDRDVWVAQRGEPGWFDRPVRAAADEAREGARKALDEMIDRVGG